MFQKEFFRYIIKMTLTDKIKVLDDKIRENEAQFILDRGPAWI